MMAQFAKFSKYIFCFYLFLGTDDDESDNSDFEYNEDEENDEGIENEGADNEETELVHVEARVLDGEEGKAFKEEAKL